MPSANDLPLGFEAPLRAGLLPAGHGAIARGRAGSWPPGPLAQIDLAAAAGSACFNARFKAHGSPWIIAACELLCEMAEGQDPGWASLPGAGEGEARRRMADPADPLGAWSARARSALSDLSADSSVHAADGLAAWEAMSKAILGAARLPAAAPASGGPAS